MTGSEGVAENNAAPPPPWWEAVLRDEFGAEDGSFLIQLRIDLEWDRTAFSRLAGAMQACCEDKAGRSGEECLARWLAEGFWYVPSFTRDWTSHDAWRDYVARDPDYHAACLTRLDELAYWFFVGESPLLIPMAPL